MAQCSKVARPAKDLTAEIGSTEANLLLLRTGKVKGVKVDTLAKICEALDCHLGDILNIDDEREPALKTTADPD